VDILKACISITLEEREKNQDNEKGLTERVDNAAWNE